MTHVHADLTLMHGLIFQSLNLVGIEREQMFGNFAQFVFRKFPVVNVIRQTVRRHGLGKVTERINIFTHRPDSKECEHRHYNSEQHNHYPHHRVEAKERHYLSFIGERCK